MRPRPMFTVCGTESRMVCTSLRIGAQELSTSISQKTRRLCSACSQPTSCSSSEPPCCSRPMTVTTQTVTTMAKSYHTSLR